MLCTFSLFHLNTLWVEYFYFPFHLRVLRVKKRLSNSYGSELESASFEAYGSNSRDPQLQPYNYKELDVISEDPKIRFIFVTV